MNDKLETGAMLNPNCQKCSKKDTCNNKTLCAYLIPKDIKIDRNVANAQEPIQMSIKITPEMIEKQIREKISDKSLEIGIDFGKGYTQCGRLN